MTDDKRIYTLSSEKPAKAVLKMGLPLVCGMFVMVLYNLVDTYFIGKLNDDYQLAAVSLAYPLMMVMIAISNMVGTGCSSLIARSLGAKDYETANRTVSVGFALTFVMSLLVTAAGLIFLNPLVDMLGADKTTFEFTRQYSQVILIGSFATMGSFTFGQLLRSEGSATFSIVGMIAGTVTNIVLDPVFIFGLRMEIRGAAIATVIGNIVGALCPVIYYVKKRSILRPSLKLALPTAKILGEIFWVGVPATLETLLTAGAAIVLNNLAAAYGALTVAAMGISSKLMSFGSYIYQGFAAGLQPLMGFNFGAKNYRRMMALIRAGIAVITGAELIVMAAFAVFAPQLIDIFTDTAEVVRIGAVVLRANMFILPFVGSIAASRATFQAMGKPQYAFSITVVRQLVLYVPLQLLMNNIWGFGGMIWAQPLTECIMMLASLMLLFGVISKFMKNQEGL